MPRDKAYDCRQIQRRTNRISDLVTRRKLIETTHSPRSSSRPSQSLAPKRLKLPSRKERSWTKPRFPAKRRRPPKMRQSQSSKRPRKLHATRRQPITPS
ncbi:hypothetical protein HIM_10623 [Hirsutella minnesotensis 3608]|uniref:Uncharacterized protein n=1 Tax=Hirsutella minnesotensis 3608 TaxID=1043627 RepID=A0A0F7ZIT0_9HYPO|nr:hypothetical protein HIM_11753 [Hirsutella minnesotensis 3608]KJZ69978.1 hypothetical protein HIM_10623 [Hirsutella minnesotensis 3608]